MKTITIKMDESILREIDSVIRKHRYSTRTEFIRDAVRVRLREMEKEIAIQRLATMRGALKGKARLNDDKLAGELAAKELAAKFGIKID